LREASRLYLTLASFFMCVQNRTHIAWKEKFRSKLEVIRFILH